MLIVALLFYLLTLEYVFGTKSKFLDRGSKQFVPKTLVMAIDQNSQENELLDQVAPENAWAERVYLIKTSLEERSSIMYRFDLTGYSYGSGQPMDCLWVGYLYDSPVGPPLQAFNTCINPEGLEASTYIEGGYLHLKVGPISRFCNAFELFYQGHYQNATMGLEYRKYEATAAVVPRGTSWNLEEPSFTMHQNNRHENEILSIPIRMMKNIIRYSLGNVNKNAVHVMKLSLRSIVSVNYLTKQLKLRKLCKKISVGIFQNYFNFVSRTRR